MPITPLDKFDFPSKSYGPGSTTSPVRPVSGSVRRVGFRYDCTNHTNSNIVVNATIEYSFDGGAIWRSNGFQRIGGVVPRDPQGVLAPFIECEFAFQAKSNFSMRGTLNITGGSIVTSGTIWCA